MSYFSHPLCAKLVYLASSPGRSHISMLHAQKSPISCVCNIENMGVAWGRDCYVYSFTRQQLLLETVQSVHWLINAQVIADQLRVEKKREAELDMLYQ